MMCFVDGTDVSFFRAGTLVLAIPSSFAKIIQDYFIIIHIFKYSVY